MAEYILLQEAFALLFTETIGLLLSVFLAVVLMVSMMTVGRREAKPLDVHIVGNDDA